MGKILGIDLGTNSIGLAVRDTDQSNEFSKQLIYFTSDIFKSGVGTNKNGEFSFAAERTAKRRIRRLYQSRKYRIWATLRLLIENGYCPLTIEELEKWCKYDKNIKRQYPINSISFNQWIKLDFNGDGIPDYKSPYQLRAELASKKISLEKEENRFKLGRALYHIAQRRGFKSSKGEKINDNPTETDTESDIEALDQLKESENKKSEQLKDYMEKHHCKTVGCAFALLENEGIRVRNSSFQAVRAQYKEEIKFIFDFQGISKESPFYIGIISEKKKEGTIFYKRPLRSQKANVGKCTLENSRSRCPISHPDFETFRAWSMINNIKYRTNTNVEWKELTLEQKQKLYNEKFLRLKKNFKFEEIRLWMAKEIHLNHLSYDATINFKDNTNISGCPVTARLKNLLSTFSEDWENVIIHSNTERINKKTGEVHEISYNIYDIWHICYSFDDEEFVYEFSNRLDFTPEQEKCLLKIWAEIQQGYAMLSLKAIRNINRFLKDGHIYSESVLLAKIPDILGEEIWAKNRESIIKNISDIFTKYKSGKDIINITNSLIADWKSLPNNDRFGYKDSEYKLDQSDFKDIENKTTSFYGSYIWNTKKQSEKDSILNSVKGMYQSFFKTMNRDYIKQPKIWDYLAEYIEQCVTDSNRNEIEKKLYHPSMIQFYPKSKNDLLGSPVIGAIKNPMAMRVLHILRGHINKLIRNGIIDEETKIVVELANELNDANWRKAISTYQKSQEEINKEIENIISQITDYKGEKSNTDKNKLKLLFEQTNRNETEARTENEIIYEKYKKEIIEKYRLWREQGFRCIYTGKTISISELFDGNKFDFEHTMPRSRSFDDSLANKTICEADFNRRVKRNRLPSELDENTYNQILERINPWIDKVNNIKNNIAYWKNKARNAVGDMEQKNRCIYQQHLWELELQYWSKKVKSFTCKDIPDNWRNSQLNDTRTITKYAYHYLKSLFSNVIVVNGSTTDVFKKIAGIQGFDERKDRSKHSHHAIDAATLTLIPNTAESVKLNRLFYIIKEKEALGENCSYEKQELDKEKKLLGLSHIDNYKNFIEETIFINHIKRDKCLNISRRRMKKSLHGRKKEYIIVQGDCIRGQLHEDSFFGAIKQAKVDENNNILRDNNGNIITEEEPIYVIREELKYKANETDNGFKTWEHLEESIVNKRLYTIMRNQFPESTNFKDACNQGIYMLDKHGNKVNKIRHIRCIKKIKNPLEIKRQTYPSKKDYKNYYYANMGDLYCMCVYSDNEGHIKEYVVYSLFKVIENRKFHGEDFLPTITKKDKKLHLDYRLIVGDTLLIYKDSIDKLKDLDRKDLINKLYVITRFESDKRINLVKANNAQIKKELGNGKKITDYNNMPEYVRCAISTIKYLVKGIHFEVINDNEIVFK